MPFAALDGKKYRVDIFSEGWVWEPVVLKGGANPFYTQEDDDEDAFYPIRTSSGYLTVIVEDMQLIDDLIPNDDHDRYVELLDITNELQPVRAWNGFIAPDEYSGMWDKTPFELSLPLLSPLASARSTRFNPTEIFRECHYLIKSIFNSYLEVAPTYLWFAKLDEDTPGIDPIYSEPPPTMVPFLSARLMDSIFLPNEKEDTLKPRYGSDPLPQLKSKCFSAVDVLEALCRAFGYVLYETPDNYYFAAPDKTNVYRRVEFAHVNSSGFDEITLSNSQFPTIAGTDHSRTLIPGKSLVRVYCELPVLTDLLSLDLTSCAYWDHFYDFPDGQDNDPEHCTEILRWDALYYSSSQYENNTQTGRPLDNMINVQAENYDFPGSRRYVGGNWISYMTFQRRDNTPISREGFPNEDALVVTTTESSYTDHLYAGRARTRRKYCANHIPYNNLFLCLEARFSKSFRNYQFDDSLSNDNIVIYCTIKWGDYYYQQPLNDTVDQTRPYWATTFNLCTLKLVSDDNTSFSARHYGTPGALINTYTNYAETGLTLQGEITVTFYTFPETQDVKMMRITDLKISAEHVNKAQGRRGDVVDYNYPDYLYDYGMIDFRQSLSVFRLSEYAYKNKFTTCYVNWSQAVISTPDPITNTSYEQLLLSRLAQWYDRTIEQLSVTVENEDIEPGVRIVRGNVRYIVVSRTRDWRNGRQILTIQKMYDEQSQSET